MRFRTRQWIAGLGVAIMLPACLLAIYSQLAADDRLLSISGMTFFGAAWVFGLPSLPLHWRGETVEAQRDRPPSGWPYSEELWQGWVRSSFLFGAFAGPMFVIVFLFLGINGADWPVSSDELGGWFDALFALAVFSFVGVSGLGLSVIVFNRPKWAVPPSMRDQYGWIINLDSY